MQLNTSVNSISMNIDTEKPMMEQSNSNEGLPGLITPDKKQNPLAKKEMNF